ncbi:MAG: GAF domain-containing protein [Anaerolineaceae bacterium]|nr:GAF domain-containing protein [Anaerolineaceae bacterium]
MIQDAINFIFAVRYPYTSRIDRQRARILLLFALMGMVAILGWLVFIILPALFSGSSDFTSTAIVLALLAPLVMHFIYRFIQRGRLNTAVRILLILILGWTILTARNGLGSSQAILYVLPIVVAGIFLPRRDQVMVVVTQVLIIGGGAFIQSQSTAVERIVPAETLMFDLAIILTVMLIMFILLIMFSRTLGQAEHDQQENIERLSNIASFMSHLPLGMDERSALNHVVSLIHQQFPLVAARIYLRDMVGNLVLSSGGELGQPVLSGEEMIKLTDANVISEAARLREPRSIMRRERLDVRSHRLRPSSNIGLAIPIVTTDEDVLGVIDLQSIQTDPFSDDEIQMLVTLSNMVGALLMWLRANQNLAQVGMERDANLERLQARLSEYEERERHTSNVWGTYLQERGAALIGFNLVEGQNPELIPANDLPEALRPAWEQGEIQVEIVGNEQIISVPIQFRDTTLGAMSFTVPVEQAVSKRHLEIAQTVSQRLALALENARLFEQSRTQAQRERAASEFTTLLTGAGDVKTALNLAVQNFNDSLGAIHTRIYLQPEVLTGAAQYEDTVK